MRELERLKTMMTVGAVMDHKARRNQPPAKAKTIVSKPPPPCCDVCKGKIGTVFVDGRMTYGSWADMCWNCFRQHGVGLGTGKGQKYKAPGALTIPIPTGHWVKVAG